jgi:hypothetical protein
MRRVQPTNLSREQCLQRALDCEWRAEDVPAPALRAIIWDEARWWRSLALVATPAAAATPDPAG